MSGPAARRVLALSGLEPSGRVGLFVDLEAIRLAGAKPLGIATALTAQGERTFFSQAVSLGSLRSQLSALLEQGPLDALKLGMVPSRAVLREIRRGLQGLRIPWVVDPVVRSSRGQRLSTLRAEDYLELAGSLVTITPNTAEAGWLLGWKKAPTAKTQALEAAQTLVERGFGAAVVKGGHLVGAPADVVCTAAGVRFLEGLRLVRSAKHHRGTGCRFAATLAAYLARGETVEQGARVAKKAVERSLSGV